MSVTNLSSPLTKRYAGLGQILKIERKITEAERVLSVTSIGAVLATYRA